MLTCFLAAPLVQSWSAIARRDLLEQLDSVAFVCATLALVAFTLSRRPATTVDQRPLTIAVVAASALVFVAYQSSDAAVARTTLAIMVVLRVLADGSLLYLGRSFALLPALRAVRTTGPYAVIRHPAYASYMLGELWFCIAWTSTWNCMVFAIAASLYLKRIHIEEHVLMASAEYRDYTQRVKWRFVPGVY